MMDTICEKMDDYARATTKKTGELKLLRLMTHEGKMNPEISEVDFVQDSDLNKSLKFYVSKKESKDLFLKIILIFFLFGFTV